MKYLKRFNESVNNQSNESYIDLMYILGLYFYKLLQLVLNLFDFKNISI